VVAAHQLNRNAEHDGKQMDQRPKLSQLRESGSVEQDADQVLLIWPFQKDPRNGQPVDWQADPRPVEVALCKNRHGPQALVYLDFHRKYTTFTECGQPAPTPLKDPYKSFGFKQQERLPGDD
jgi:replicative DNA helicase